MGTLIFGIDIQAEVADAIPSSEMPPVTLLKTTILTTYSRGLTYGPDTTVASYVTWGIEADYVLKAMKKATNVQEGDKGVMMIGKALEDAGVEPTTNDQVIIDGKTYDIIQVDRDPAKAQYLCRCRG